MKKVLTVLGARPQFIKAAIVSKELRKYCNEIIIHTGQHYDNNMSQLFFDELEIPQPHCNLEVRSITQVEQVSTIMAKLAPVIHKHKPDLILTYGDTNSTIGGALTAAMMDIQSAHIEAGLRSYNKSMPEEINRVVTDHVSDILFAPSYLAMNNLVMEGLKEKAYYTGDVMYDAIQQYELFALRKSKILESLDLEKKKYYYVTLHRPYNVDNREIFTEIISSFKELDSIFVFPIHPRTRIKMENYNLKINKNVKIIEPVSYLDSLILQKYAIKIQVTQ